MSTHLAAVSPAKGAPFTLHPRRTPVPGPGDLLIAVKSLALNPADCLMRAHGLFIPPAAYPTVLGFDIAGLVLAVGSSVPVVAPADGGPFFVPGTTRVAAYSASFWRNCDPDYGAFQEHCLVPWQHAAPIPSDNTISWNAAATLPVAAEVALHAWDLLGIPRLPLGSLPPSPTLPVQQTKTHALLIWGASSSVGTMGVQSARLHRSSPSSTFAAVYATAGAANHAYVRTLGADRVFDHRAPSVAASIIAAARADGLVIQHCFLATGALAACQAVLRAFSSSTSPGKIASAPIIPPDAAAVEGVETVFVLPSADEAERLEQFSYWLGTWLRENLANGSIRPSPEPTVVGKGLGDIDAGLDVLARGEVSCAKLVVEVAE